MLNKTYVMGAFIVFAAILTVTLSFSSEAVSALSSINFAGALAAAFAVIVGLAWFLRAAKKA